VETPIGVQWRQAREICRANARPNWKEQPPWRRSPAYNGARPERSNRGSLMLESYFFIMATTCIAIFLNATGANFRILSGVRPSP
jgi:hypothetical protein